MTKNDISNMTSEQLDENMDLAYLELGDIHRLPVVNPMVLAPLNDVHSDEYVENFIGFLRNPNYLSFFCEHVLNVKLLPFQLVILDQLWHKPFPMLIASRGASKCLTGDTIIPMEEGMLSLEELLGTNNPYMTEIPLNKKVYGERGWDQTKYGWCNGLTETIKIKTSSGYDIEGTLNHPLRVVRNGKIEWVNLSDIKINDNVIICRDKIDLENNHKDIDEDIAWWLGATVGDGMVSQKSKVYFTNIDADLIEKWCRIGSVIFGKEVKRSPSDPHGYNFYGVDKTKWVNEYYQLNNKKAHDKSMPRIIRESGSKNIAAFLRGLFDTDGYVNNKGIGYTTVSDTLMKQVVSCLLTFGIICNFNKRDYYNNSSDKAFPANTLIISDKRSIELYNKYIGFDCSRKLNRLKIVLSRNKKMNPNKDTLPKELINPLIQCLNIKRKERKIFFDRNKNRYEIALVSNYRLNKYRMSYDTLQEILNIFKDLKDEPEYLDLQDIYNKNYFYDNITLIEKKENITYDIYVPDSHSFISNGFISHNSFLLAIYTICRAVLDQGSRICVVGAALRQSLIIFNYIQTIWDASPILQDICGGQKNRPKRELHMCTWKCGSSDVKFLPLGNGETIRGQRATVVLVDEYSSVDPTVFETVVRGFAAVKSQGLLASVSHEFKKMAAKELGLNIIETEDTNGGRIQTKTNLGCNQIVIAGTTSYQFNHFYKYFKYYKAIIESAGDANYIKENYPEMPPMIGIDSSDYCIMRIPYDLVPPGMMDQAILSQGRATMNSSIFDQEYGCIFPSDSDGFYPASLLHACTCPIAGVDGNILFGGKIVGSLDKTCVMGVDPASENDNFAINIIEINGFSRHIVYQWSTNRKRFQELKEQKLISEEINDYLTFCIKHIRSLTRRFNISMIVCDAGGGGLSIKEGLQDKDKCENGEVPIYDMDDDIVKGNQGRYILKMINFQSDDWRKNSHYGLKKDFSDRRLIFPKFDLLESVESNLFENNIKYETLDDCYIEIEHLKNEITLVKHEQTANGSEKWVVPKLKVAGSENINAMLKKDRFTSLLLANWGCRILENESQNTANYYLVGTTRNYKPDNQDPGNIRYLKPDAKRLRILGDESNYQFHTKR